MQEMLQHHHDIISAGSRVGYQLCVIIAALTGGWLIRKDAAAWDLPDYRRWSIMVAALIGSLIGCAIPAYFAGGFVGGVAWTTPIMPKTVMGGLLMSFLIVAAFKMITSNRADTSDAFARGAIAIMAIGRIGCILQHCCYGKHVAWGFDFGDGITRVPVQYIEAAGLFVIFYMIQHMHLRNLFPGRRLFIVFALYGLMRFVLEFWRETIASEFAGIGFYQWLALLIALVGITQIMKRTRQRTVLLPAQ